MIGLIYGAVESPDEREFLVDLYRRYDRLMWAMIRRSCGDAGAWEDILQETVLHLIEKVALLRSLSEDALAGYVATAARNTAYSHLRKLAREREKVVPLEDLEPEAPGEGVEARILREDHLAAVWPRLSQGDRYLLEGSFLLGLDQETMARTLGCKPDSLRMKLTRARRRAAKLLREEGLE